MTAQQMTFPGAPEHAHAAREWVDGQTGHHPYSRLIAGELFAMVLASAGDVPGQIQMAVTVVNNRRRITAYGPRPVARPNLISNQLLSTLTERHGVAPDCAGWFAEITR